MLIKVYFRQKINGEKDIMQIRSVKEKEYINGKCSKIINYVKCKFILLYILDFILMFFFWLYVGLFCAVFKNTQIYLIKKTLISFGFYLLYPFVFVYHIYQLLFYQLSTYLIVNYND